MKLSTKFVCQGLFAIAAICNNRASATETKENLRKESPSKNRELQFGFSPFFDWSDAPLFFSFPFFCFSPYAKTNVLGKGRVMMKDLEVGDKVLTASGQYKTMYSMNHRNPNKETEYIQITTNLEEEQPLELTPSHMLFVDGKDHPVPAYSVKIGDKVQSLHKGSADVVEIKKVVRNGLYNPLTMDSTIVVDGIVASTFITPTGGTHVQVADKSLLSYHDALKMAAAPYRNFCVGVSLDMCDAHEELSGVSKMLISLFLFWSKQVDFMKYAVYYACVSFFSLLGLAMSVKSFALVNATYLFFVASAAKKGTVSK